VRIGRKIREKKERERKRIRERDIYCGLNIYIKSTKVETNLTPITTGDE
jgi:hypothetical protein